MRVSQPPTPVDGAAAGGGTTVRPIGPNSDLIRETRLARMDLTSSALLPNVIGGPSGRLEI